MSTRRSKRNMPRKKPHRGRGTMPYQAQRQRTEYRYHSLSPEHDQWLSFVSVENFGNGTASQTKRFAVNSYTPDGSQVAAEYIRWATMYDFYRVVAFTIEVNVSNLDNKPCSVALCTSNEDVGSTYAYASAVAMPFSRHCLLSALGGGKDNHRMVISNTVAQLTGTSAVESADSYRAIINAAPADTVWASVTVEVPTGTMTNGITIQTRITQKIRFYNADLVEQNSPPSIIEHQFATKGMSPLEVLNYIQRERERIKSQRALTKS